MPEVAMVAVCVIADCIAVCSPRWALSTISIYVKFLCGQFPGGGRAPF